MNNEQEILNLKGELAKITKQLTEQRKLMKEAMTTLKRAKMTPQKRYDLIGNRYIVLKEKGVMRTVSENTEYERLQTDKQAAWLDLKLSEVNKKNKKNNKVLRVDEFGNVTLVEQLSSGYKKVIRPILRENKFGELYETGQYKSKIVEKNAMKISRDSEGRKVFNIPKGYARSVANQIKYRNSKK